MAKQLRDYAASKGVELDSLSPDDTLDLQNNLNKDLFPGSKQSPAALAAALSSPNPSVSVKSKVVVNKGYDPCDDGPTTNEMSCSPPYVSAKSYPSYCFGLAPFTEVDNNPCNEDQASRMYYRSAEPDLEVAFSNFLSEYPGPLSNSTFWLDVMPHEGELYFIYGDKLSSFSSLRFMGAAPYGSNATSFCGAYAWQGPTGYIDWAIDDCYGYTPPVHGNICVKKLLSCSDATAGSARRKRNSDTMNVPDNPTALDFLFNPALILQSENMIKQAKAASRDNFKSINLTKSYDSLFEILWYTQLPCYDVQNVTSQRKHEHGMLKSCLWKGFEVPCSQIFKTSPTDRGMCCTFNLQAAEDMFKEGRFTSIIKKMQKRDTNMTFDTDPLLFQYFNENPHEPVPQAGRSKGLTLILDAHSDLVTGSSVNDDIDGFFAIVDSKDQYPMTFRKTALIRPGHNNIVALKATEVATEAGVRTAATPEKRMCLFADEKKLQLHKKYSQANCFLECSLDIAMRAMSPNMSDPCIPWYFPVQNASIRMCDPYEAFTFVDIMKDIADEECPQCLPDCSGTTFEASVSAAPFRRCDYKNLGLSELCNFDGMHGFLDPPIWGESVMRQFGADKGSFPKYLDGKFRSNKRKIALDEKSSVFGIMNDENPEYDAYDRDIAMVTFFFESTTAFMFVRQPRMTVIDFISQIGGLLGLCMGFSFVSFVEIFYWFTFRLAKNSH